MKVESRNAISPDIGLQPNSTDASFKEMRARIRVASLAAITLLIQLACNPDASIESQPSAQSAITESGSDTQKIDGAIAESTSDATPRPKRIILISLDTAGARNVGGYSDAETPNLEKIAKDGVRFDRFYAASTYTLPSHMSMLTGLDPIEHGVVNLPSRLAPSVPTLATQLRNAGYDTKAVVEGGFVKAEFGFDQGFSKFDKLKEKKGLVKNSIWGVLDWMRNKKEAPYFLFLHTYAAHAPYAGFDRFRIEHPELDLPDTQEIARLKARFNRQEHYPAPRDIPVELRHMCTFYNLNSPAQGDWVGCGDQNFKSDFLQSKHFEVYREGLLKAHRNGIRLGDRMVGQIRDALIELGQLDDTLLIVTSDHGEGMFEHSIHGHGYLPYDEVVKVPLFLSYPRRVRGGQVVRGLTWHLDLFPTIMSFAHVPFDSSLLGMNLAEVLSNQEAIPEERAIHPLLLRPANRTPLPRRRMTLAGDYKFIEGHKLYGDPEGLLFDLKNSPEEVDNLRRSKPEIFAEMRESALDYEGSLTPGEPVHRNTGERISPFPGEVEPLELSDDVRRRLAELGYIIGGDPADQAP